jgi:hypothetical protein
MIAYYNKSELLELIKTSISDRELEHEIALFTSGCFMIDAWIKNDMISIQLENDSVGLSIMKEGEMVAFTSIPDERFKDNVLFIKRLEQLLDQYDDNVKTSQTTPCFVP